MLPLRNVHRDHPVPDVLAHAFWALSGAVVLAFILASALGALEPNDAVELTVAVLVLAALLLAHMWRELWRDERRP